MSNEAIGLSRTRPVMRPATVAALVTGGALVTKVLAILASGNTAPEAITTGLYLIGMVAPIVFAVAVARRRPSVLAKVGTGVGIVLAHLFYVTMLSDAVEGLVAPFTATAYVLDEVPVAVLGIIWLAVAGRLLRDPS